MTAAIIDPNIADRLAKLCGMFSSDYEGERATAAAMADKLVRANGLTWPEILVPTAGGQASVEEQIEYAIASGHDVLNGWEWGFICGIRGREHLTKRQLRKLADIVAKVRNAEGRP